MNFDINIWLKFRNEASKINETINSFKNSDGTSKLSRDDLNKFINEITIVLAKCADYMDAVGLKMPTPPFRYNPEDETTHPSSENFAYSHLMKHI